MKSALPKNIKPMLSTLVSELPKGKEWLYEIKWDGYRAISYCRGKNVEIRSRNDKSFNEKYYPIYESLQKLKLHAVLDGEIVVLKESGVTSFGALQNWRSEADGELYYYVFDLLWLDGNSLLEKPLFERKKILRGLLPKDGSIRESESFKLPMTQFEKSLQGLGVEGFIAKRIDSLYHPGVRGSDWLKIKIQKRHEVVIGGYTVNEGTKKPFSSLLVGVFEKGSFNYIGKIGTGFSVKAQNELMAEFKPLITSTPPFTVVPDINKPSRFRPNPPKAMAVWLKPKLVCEVSYIELTEDGIMRHPSFEGLRVDKKALDVHLEEAHERVEIPEKLGLTPIKSKERKTLLNPKEETQVKIINNHELKFNNLSKVYWPKENYTKRDLLNYYYQAAPFILPYLMNRPQSLNRFPNGIYGESFYQKDVTKTGPLWIHKYPYRTSDGKDKNFIIVEQEADLLWMANLGAIEMNPWNSTIKKPDYPTWCLIDIDPTEKNSFEQVIETALATKNILDSLQIESYCKTSGADGLHIYIPMGEKYTYDQCQLFARLVAGLVHETLPEFTSIERFNVKRKGKIYVDFLQNRPKATLAAPYAVRPKPFAPVSMPLHWKEVKKGLNPLQFNLKNAISRMKSNGDLFKPVLGKGIDLNKALKLMEKLF